METLPLGLSPTTAFLLQIAAGFVTGALARQRGRHPMGWFIAGMFGGVFAVGILAFLPDLERLRLFRRLEWMEEQAKLQMEEPLAQPSTEVASKPSAPKAEAVPMLEPEVHGWYVAERGGEPEGPFDLRTLRARLAEGSLRNCMVWHPKMDAWATPEQSPLA